MAEPVKSADFKAYLSETRGMERDFLKEIIRSKRRAWGVTYLMFGLSVLAIGAGIVGLSRETPSPLVLRVDNATGAVDVVTTMREHESSYGDVVDDYWINRYMIDRENYEYNAIQQNYDAVALLSAPDIQKEYYARFEGADGLDKTLSNQAQIIAHVKSIQLNHKGQATVRFTTQLVYADRQPEKVENKIATISYTYLNAPMSLTDRRINPLGFQVTTYQVDQETLSVRPAGDL
jgi:type IV secretion system protein VirB8